MTQQIFDDLVGTPPPSTVDIERIIRGESRARRVRRASWTLAAVAVVSITAVTVVSLGPQLSNMDFLNKHSATTTSETPEQIAGRIDTAWKAATARVLPGAVWFDLNDRSTSPAAPTPRRLDGGLFSLGEVTFNGITSRFVFSAAEAETYAKARNCELKKMPTCAIEQALICQPRYECTSRPGPNGTEIRIQHSAEVPPDSQDPTVALTCMIFDRNGDTVVFSVSNQKGWQDTPDTSTELALTVEQVMAVLQEPGLLP